jgi:membrane-associated phospholipid phosphatase
MKSLLPSPTFNPAATTNRQAAILLAIVLVTALVCLGLAVRGYRLVELDVVWSLAIQQASLGSLRRIAGRLSLSAEATRWDLAMFLVVGGLLAFRRGADGALLLGGIIAAEAATAVTKIAVSGYWSTGRSLLAVLEADGFPSGHAVRVSVGAGLLVALFAWQTRWRWPGVVLVVALALAIGWARIAVRAHYPSDVIGAYLLAGLILDFAILARQERSPRNHS